MAARRHDRRPRHDARRTSGARSAAAAWMKTIGERTGDCCARRANGNAPRRVPLLQPLVDDPEFPSGAQGAATGRHGTARRRATAGTPFRRTGSNLSGCTEHRPDGALLNSVSESVSDHRISGAAVEDLLEDRHVVRILNQLRMNWHLFRETLVLIPPDYDRRTPGWSISRRSVFADVVATHVHRRPCGCVKARFWRSSVVETPPTAISHFETKSFIRLDHVVFTNSGFAPTAGGHRRDRCRCLELAVRTKTYKRQSRSQMRSVVSREHVVRKPGRRSRSRHRRPPTLPACTVCAQAPPLARHTVSTAKIAIIVPSASPVDFLSDVYPCRWRAACR